MKKMLKFRPFLGASTLVCAGFLAGCATSNTNVDRVDAALAEQVYAQKMADADALLVTGNRDAASLAYEKIAADNPTKGTPWAKVAQIQFALGHYSQAIVASEETLRREPASREAKSVAAVGGLRLAVRSLQELRDDSALAGDARTDAMRLAAMLRETLCESVLEPVKKAPSPVKRKPVPVKAPAAAAPAAAPAASAAGGGGNPFGSLK